MQDRLEMTLYRIAYALGLVHHQPTRALGLGSGYTPTPWPWLRGKRWPMRSMCPACEGSGYADYAAVPCELCNGERTVITWR